MVKDKSFRPDKELADQFYHLTDFSSDKRCSAACNILKQIELSKQNDDVVKYCIERIVKGLSSSRQAARVGFTVALSAIIKKLGPSIVPTIIQELRIVSTHRDSNEPFSNCAFGQVFPCLSIVQCLKSEEITADIIEQLIDPSLKIFEASPFYGHFCVQVILSLSSKIDKKLFKSNVWPRIKVLCHVPIEQCSANNLWLIYGLKDAFPDQITKKCPEYIFTADTLSDDMLKHLTQLIITTSDNFPTVHPGLICLFKSVLRDNSISTKFFKSFLERILNHERKSVVVYGYQLLEKIFSFIETEAQVSIFFSKNLFEHLLKCLIEKSPCSRVCRPYFVIFLSKFCQWVVDKRNVSISANIIRTVSSVSTNFDDLIGRRFLLTLINELIILENETEEKVTFEILDTMFDNLKDLSIKVQQKSNPAITNSIAEKSKFLTNVCLMTKNEVNIKRKILLRFVEILSIFDNDSKEILPVKSILEGKFFDCIESCYNVQSGPRLLNSVFTEEHCRLIAEILDTLYESRKDKIKNQETYKAIKKVKKVLSKMENYESLGIERGFYVLMQYFAMGAIVNFSEFDPILEEILACYKDYSSKPEIENNTKDTWLDVLMDLILSILSKENRHLRFPIEVAVSNMASLVKKRHLEPIFKYQYKWLAEKCFSFNDVTGSTNFLLMLPLEVAKTINQLLTIIYLIKKYESLKNIRMLNKSFLVQRFSGQFSYMYKEVLNVANTDEVMEDEGDLSEVEENGIDEGKEQSDDEESEKADDEDDDDENEDKVEVNKALEDAIENALKDADALETESVKSDISDDTMLKLDEKLADVFKLHSKSSKVRNRIEQTTLSFRMRCFEVLLIFVHSIEDTSVLMDMILPLVDIIQQASKFGHQHSSIVKRANFVMNAICIKKLNLDEKCDRTADEICSIVDGIFKTSNCTADIYVQNMCFEALKFILRIGARVFENDPAYTQALKKVVDENLESFVGEKACLTPANHFNYIFEKYPDVFLVHVVNFAEKLADNNLRFFRTTELATFCQLILSKVNLSALKEDKSKLKIVKKFMKVFVPFFMKIVDKLLQILTDKPKSPLKSTFLLAIISIAKCLQRFHEAQLVNFDLESGDHHIKLDKQQIDYYRDVLQNLSMHKIYRTKGKSSQNHVNLCTLLKRNLPTKPQRFFAELGKLFFTDFKAGDQDEAAKSDSKEDEERETPMKKKKLEN